jgi:hypothetical protein
LSPEDPIQISSPPQESLQSWKEIASFLGVTPRPAQLWAAERGLPIRRIPGRLGRVFAYTADLTAWRDGNLSTPPLPEPPPPSPPRNLRWLYWAVPAVLLAAALLVWFPNRPRGIPSAWRLDGQLLTVIGSEGTTLWTYRFPQVPIRNWERDSSHSRPDFFDVDGDGLQEFLFPFNSGTSPSPGPGTMLCFSSSGAIRWSFRIDKTIATADGSRYHPPFIIRQFAPVPAPGNAPPRLLVTLNHATDFPSAAVLLDPNGAPLRSYWHAGHLHALLVTDLVPGAGPEIYLGAISNSLNRPSLIALDPESFSGTAPEQNPKYRITGMAQPRELARIVLNRLRIGPPVNPFGLIGSLRRHGDTLVVGVSEDQRPEFAAAHLLTFLPRLTLQEVSFASYTYSVYRRLHAQGLITSPDPDLELPDLKKLLYLTPWPPAPTLNGPPPPPDSD